MPDVFVSYSRKDKPFVEKLVQNFQQQGLDVWVDWEDIPFASEWWDEIQRGIESSQKAVFVVSPDSVGSQVCGLEVNYIHKNNKQLVPIVYRDVRGLEIPPVIAGINWLFFSQPEQFDQSFQQLLTTLNTDLDHIRQHTLLLVQAREWERAGHDPSRLLRGAELEQAEALLDRADLTELQQQFVLTSQERERRVEMGYRFIWGLIGGLLGIGFWAFSTFRSDVLFSPQRIVYTIALGQVFGLCLGLMSAFAGELPNPLSRWLKSPPLRVGVRAALFLIVGVFAWISYIWLLERFSTTPQDWNMLLLAGIGLGAGFLIRSEVKWPAWVFVLLMTTLIWLPIYITFQDNFVNFVPLIYFDQTAQAAEVGIPLALLMALGANMLGLLKEMPRVRQQASAPESEEAPKLGTTH
jgi:hypothetical protein